MEVSKRKSKRKAEDGEREEWYVTQRSYIKDLIEKSEEKVKKERSLLPVTKLTLKHQRLHLRWKKCEELKNVLEKYFGFSPAHALTSCMV
jgi:hypothetical protein